MNPTDRMPEKGASRWMRVLGLGLVVGAAIVVTRGPRVEAAGDLEPSGPPAPTMKSLDEIPPSWHQVLPVAERFELVMGDEAVLDKETGLVWARDADPANATMIWTDANDFPRDLEIGGRKGWRLPTVEELSSLVDPGASSPSLPAGHPFQDIGTGWYWTSSQSAGGSGAWVVVVNTGLIRTAGTASALYVWPVRGGSAD